MGRSKCSEPECAMLATGRGLCNTHYQRQWYRENRESQQAYMRSRYARLTPEQKAKSYERQNQWRAANTANIKRHSRAREGHWKGFSAELESLMFSQQRGMCACCGRQLLTEVGSSRIYQRDHADTENGPVPRGLICQPCNYGLGIYEKHLRSVSKYPLFERYLKAAKAYENHPLIYRPKPKKVT